MTHDDATRIWLLATDDESPVMYYAFGGDYTYDCAKAFGFACREDAESFGARLQLQRGFGHIAVTFASAVENHHGD